MYSAQNSNTFLAYFNQIDKYLSYVLWIKKYVPYHERVTIIATGKTSITRFVKSFEAKLRYFGDLRNQLVHGFRLENKHYLVVSDHALHEIQTIHDHLTAPKTIADYTKKEYIIANNTDTIQAVMELMTEHSLSYIPVYDVERLLWVLSFQDIMYRLISHTTIQPSINTLAEVDVTHYSEYDVIWPSTSVYEVQDIFEQQATTQVLLISADGSPDTPMTGMISITDLPSLLQDL